MDDAVIRAATTLKMRGRTMVGGHLQNFYHLSGQCSFQSASALGGR
jgi:hypothetical protein